jgi:hypothetical protein
MRSSWVVTLRCPICREDFDFRSLLREPGMRGAVRCPQCKGRVSFSSPYRVPIAIISLLLAWALLANLHVHTILGFAIGTVLIWPPLSLLLTAYSVRIKPIILKEWKESRETPPRRRDGGHSLNGCTTVTRRQSCSTSVAAKKFT